LDFAPDLNELEQLIASGKPERARAKYASIGDRIERSAGEEARLTLEYLRAQILATEDDYTAAVDLAEPATMRGPRPTAKLSSISRHGSWTIRNSRGMPTIIWGWP